MLLSNKASWALIHKNEFLAGDLIDDLRYLILGNNIPIKFILIKKSGSILTSTNVDDLNYTLMSL